MIEFFEVMFRALTGLKLTMPSLISVFVVFALGYAFAKFAKNIGVLKALLILIVGYFISTILSALLGVYTLAFILGFLSNQSVLLYRVLIWAEDLSEILYSLKHRHAFEEIHNRERELEAEINRLHEELKRQKEQSKQQKQSSSQRQEQQQQKSKSQSQSQKKSSGSKTQSEMDRCLKILGLKIGQEYTRKEIKKAYRRLAMIHHPDMPNGSHEKFVEIGNAMEYLMKHL